ncbi:hypothetical protein [Planococcus shenhongbingii]|uniref:Lipoprotein n=1 Tax=Planococcus shenhongbingii TaxID=3058398 RepID=A0ABT8ND44_9BACL|nr:hypothetical protein [Planococcus sp. N017]MDN7245614.1 hypothetical protein [Planococcus sp. N017]
MKRIFVLVTFLLIVLSGCSSDGQMIFAGESDSWKATFIFKDLGDGVQERSGTIEYIGEDPKPDEVTVQFFYRIDQESFGGSRGLNKDGSYSDIEPTTCTTCVMYEKDDEIPGIIEWADQKESLILTSK